MTNIKVIVDCVKQKQSLLNELEVNISKLYLEYKKSICYH